MNKIIDKVALIEVQDQKLLVILSQGKDTWYMPGGKREGDETDEQTLRREIQEELSVRIDPDSIKPYDTIEAPAHGQPAGTMVRMSCYTARYTGTPQPNNEVVEIAWFSYADKPKVALAGQIVMDDLHAKGLIS